MAELKEFRLPDVGEGLTEADIVSWHVKPAPCWDSQTEGRSFPKPQTDAQDDAIPERLHGQPSWP